MSQHPFGIRNIAHTSSAFATADQVASEYEPFRNDYLWTTADFDQPPLLELRVNPPPVAVKLRRQTMLLMRRCHVEAGSVT